MRVYSKHSLNNGAGVGESSPPANSEDNMSDKIPTWGYKGSESKLFELAPGEALPAGWADSPVAAPVAAPEPKKPKGKKSESESETATEEAAVDGDSD